MCGHIFYEIFCSFIFLQYFCNRKGNYEGRNGKFSLLVIRSKWKSANPLLCTNEKVEISIIQ